MINIYINVAVTGNVNEVLAMLLRRIHQSDIYEACEKIVLVVNGDINRLELLMEKKYHLFHPNLDILSCEFPTLNMLWQESLVNVGAKVLYLHTKGVTKTTPTIWDWTNYMAHFNINQWRDRVVQLEEFDCTGVNLLATDTTPLHYSGNFWWAKTSHLKKLACPVEGFSGSNFVDRRMKAETWVCSLKSGKYHNAWSSNINHYYDAYPPNLYEA